MGSRSIKEKKDKQRKIFYLLIFEFCYITQELEKATHRRRTE